MFVLLFLAILVSGLAIITGIILSISGLASDRPKMRNAGFIVFGTSLVAMIFSIYFMVTGVVTKVKETIVDPFGNMVDSLNNYQGQAKEGDLLSDNRYYLLADSCTNQQIKYIKEESRLKNKTFQNSFYTYFGSQGFSRMPLIYPYAIHCMESKDKGVLVNEENVVDIENTPGGEENLVFNISAVNYDAHVVLMRISSFHPQTNRDMVSYVLYSDSEKKSKDYTTEAELFKAAAKAGYKGEKQLISLWDYDGMF